MKVVVKKEFDGRFYVASCENIPGCYAQSPNQTDLMNNLQTALNIYKNNCEDRNQPLPNEHDRPVLDIRIRFSELSTDQLVKIFRNSNYHIEYINQDSVLLLNSEFPFNRIHLPNVNYLSPMLVKKVFGEDNTIYVKRKTMKLNASFS
jgi:predicted RNase H-like HicB family nuclease